MKASDRAIVIGLAILGMLAAFWFLLLAPKREEAATLQEEVTALEDEVASQEALVTEGEAAREDFDSNYRQLVVLGKAVPEAADTSSLIAEFSDLSSRANLEYRTLDLVDDGGGAPTTAAAQTTTDQAEAESTSEEGEPEGESAAPTAQPATEASAAGLPIGATVGPAGLPVMPYSMQFTGGFFDFADFLAGVDSRVRSDGNQVVVNGRLMTIDGFALAADPRKGFPDLLGELYLTSYVTPDDQGLLAGASPTGPAPTPTASPSTAPTTPAPGTAPASATP